MRQLECPWCTERIDESQAGWEDAAETGRCPSCRRFYDTLKEAEEEEKVARAARDPKLLREIRRARLAAAFGAPACVVITVVLLLIPLSFARYFAMATAAMAASLLAFAVKHSVRDEVRGPLGRVRRRGVR